MESIKLQGTLYHSITSKRELHALFCKEVVKTSFYHNMISHSTKWVILGLCFLSHNSENIFFSDSQTLVSLPICILMPRTFLENDGLIRFEAYYGYASTSPSEMPLSAEDSWRVTMVIHSCSYDVCVVIFVSICNFPQKLFGISALWL